MRRTVLAQWVPGAVVPAEKGRVGRPEKFIDPDAGPVAALAQALRTLRHEAGDPTYAALARRSGLSASTLSEAARGRRLASWDTVQAFVRACGGDLDEWRAKWEAAARLPALGTAAPPAAPAEPEPPVEPVRARRLRVTMMAAGLATAAAIVLGVLLMNSKAPVNSPTHQPRDASTWVRVIGPGCSRHTEDAQVDVDRGWMPAGSGWTGDGCDGRGVTAVLFGSPTQWDKTVGWAFEPYGSGAPAICRLDVYIPRSPDAAGTAMYRILGKDATAAPIKEWVPVRQAAHRGSWVTLGSYQFPQGVINLELFNVGTGGAYIAADAARATCS